MEILLKSCDEVIAPHTGDQLNQNLAKTKR